MLQEVFYWLFNMSITAAITGVLVLLLRAVKRIPRRLSVFLWAIPFLRMAVPLGLNSPYSLMTLLSRLTTKTVVVYKPAEDLAFSMMNSVMAADTYFPITYKVNLLDTVFGVAAVIWVTVFAIIAAFMATSYFTTLFGVRDAVCLKGRVYISEKVTVPAVYGIIKPRIILPLAYRDKNAELILKHEAMHIRRGDNLWRTLAFLVTAAHWFNPLCWLFLKLLLEDMELACDEKVIAEIGEERAKEYALTLLECGKSTTVFAAAFGGAKIRTRIESVLSFKRVSGFSLGAFAVLIGAVCYVLLTNAG